MRHPEEGPNAVDVHVGMRVRLRRKQLGFSQEYLAQKLGLTFQQVQKYERGANRISASKLFEIAKALETPVAYFFEGIAGSTPPGADRYSQTYNGLIEEMLAEPNGPTLVKAFLSIRRRSLRTQITNLICAIAANDADASSLDAKAAE